MEPILVGKGRELFKIVANDKGPGKAVELGRNRKGETLFGQLVEKCPTPAAARKRSRHLVDEAKKSGKAIEPARAKAIVEVSWKAAKACRPKSAGYAVWRPDVATLHFSEGGLGTRTPAALAEEYERADGQPFGTSGSGEVVSKLRDQAIRNDGPVIAPDGTHHHDTTYTLKSTGEVLTLEQFREGYEFVAEKDKGK